MVNINKSKNESKSQHEVEGGVGEVPEEEEVYDPNEELEEFQEVISEQVEDLNKLRELFTQLKSGEGDKAEIEAMIEAILNRYDAEDAKFVQEKLSAEADLAARVELPVVSDDDLTKPEIAKKLKKSLK